MEDLWAGSSSVVRREDLSVSLQKHIKKEKLLRKQLQDERKQSQDVIHKLEADKNLLSKKSLELIQKFKQKTSELEKEVELLSVSKKDLELVLKEKESRAKQLLALLPDIHSYNSYKALDSKIQDSNCNNGYNGSDSNNVMSADEGLSSQYNAKNSGTDLNFLGTGGYTVLATELAAIAGVLDKKSIGTGMDIGLPISYDTHFDQDKNYLPLESDSFSTIEFSPTVLNSMANQDSSPPSVNSTPQHNNAQQHKWSPNDANSINFNHRPNSVYQLNKPTDIIVEGSRDSESAGNYEPVDNNNLANSREIIRKELSQDFDLSDEQAKLIIERYILPLPTPSHNFHSIPDNLNYRESYRYANNEYTNDNSVTGKSVRSFRDSENLVPSSLNRTLPETVGTLSKKGNSNNGSTEIAFYALKINELSDLLIDKDRIVRQLDAETQELQSKLQQLEEHNNKIVDELETSEQHSNNNSQEKSMVEKKLKELQATIIKQNKEIKSITHDKNELQQLLDARQQELLIAESQKSSLYDKFISLSNDLDLDDNSKMAEPSENDRLADSVMIKIVDKFNSMSDEKMLLLECINFQQEELNSSFQNNSIKIAHLMNTIQQQKAEYEDTINNKNLIHNAVEKRLSLAKEEAEAHKRKVVSMKQMLDDYRSSNSPMNKSKSTTVITTDESSDSKSDCVTPKREDVEAVKDKLSLSVQKVKETEMKVYELERGLSQHRQELENLRAKSSHREQQLLEQINVYEQQQMLLQDQMSTKATDIELLNVEIIRLHEEIKRHQEANSRITDINSSKEEKIAQLGLLLESSDKSLSSKSLELELLFQELAANREKLLESEDQLQKSKESIVNISSELLSQQEHNSILIVDNQQRDAAITKLAEQLQEAEANNDSSNKKIESLEVLNSDNAKVMQSMSDTIDSIAYENTISKRQVSLLQAQLVTVQEDLRMTGNQLLMLSNDTLADSSIQSLQQKVDNLSVQLHKSAELSCQKDAAIAELEQRIENSASSITDLKTQLDLSKANNESSEVFIEQLTNELNEKKNSLFLQQEDLSTVVEEKQALVAAKESLEQQMKLLLADKDVAMQELHNANRNLVSELKATRTFLQHREDMLEIKGNQLLMLSNDTLADSSIQSLQQKVDNLSVQLHKSAELSCQKDAAIAELEQRIENSASSITDLKTQLDLSKANNESSEVFIEQLTNELNEKENSLFLQQEELSAVVEEKQALVVAKESLEQQMKVLLTDKDVAMQELHNANSNLLLELNDVKQSFSASETELASLNSRVYDLSVILSSKEEELIDASVTKENLYHDKLHLEEQKQQLEIDLADRHKNMVSLKSTVCALEESFAKLESELVDTLNALHIQQREGKEKQNELASLNALLASASDELTSSNEFNLRLATEKRYLQDVVALLKIENNVLSSTKCKNETVITDMLSKAREQRIQLAAMKDSYKILQQSIAEFVIKTSTDFQEINITLMLQADAVEATSEKNLQLTQERKFSVHQLDKKQREIEELLQKCENLRQQQTDLQLDNKELADANNRNQSHISSLEASIARLKLLLNHSENLPKLYRKEKRLVDATTDLLIATQGNYKEIVSTAHSAVDSVNTKYLELHEVNGALTATIDSLKSELVFKSDVIAAGSSNLMQLDEKVEGLSALLRQKQEEIIVLQTSIDSMNMTNVDAAARVNELQSRIDLLLSECNVLLMQREDNEMKLNAMSCQSNEQESALARSQQQLLEMKQVKETLEKEISDTKQDANSRMDRIIEKGKKLNSKYKDSLEEIARLKEEHAKLQASIESLKKDHDRRIHESNITIDSLHEDNMDAIARANELESMNLSLSQINEQLRREIQRKDRICREITETVGKNEEKHLLEIKKKKELIDQQEQEKEELRQTIRYLIIDADTVRRELLAIPSLSREPSHYNLASSSTDCAINSESLKEMVLELSRKNLLIKEKAIKLQTFYQDKINSLQQELTEKCQSYSDSKDHEDELTQKLTEIGKELNLIKEQNENLSASNAVSVEQLKSKDKMIVELEGKLVTARANNKQRFDQLANTISRAQSEDSELRDQYELLQRSTEKKSLEIKILNDRIKEILQVFATTSATNNRIADIEKTLFSADKKYLPNSDKSVGSMPVVALFATPKAKIVDVGETSPDLVSSDVTEANVVDHIKENVSNLFSNIHSQSEELLLAQTKVVNLSEEVLMTREDLSQKEIMLLSIRQSMSDNTQHSSEKNSQLLAEIASLKECLEKTSGEIALIKEKLSMPAASTTTESQASSSNRRSIATSISTDLFELQEMLDSLITSNYEKEQQLQQKEQEVLLHQHKEVEAQQFIDNLQHSFDNLSCQCQKKEEELAVYSAKVAEISIYSEHLAKEKLSLAEKVQQLTESLSFNEEEAKSLQQQLSFIEEQLRSSTRTYTYQDSERKSVRNECAKLRSRIADLENELVELRSRSKSYSLKLKDKVEFARAKLAEKETDLLSAQQKLQELEGQMNINNREMAAQQFHNEDLESKLLQQSELITIRLSQQQTEKEELLASIAELNQTIDKLNIDSKNTVTALQDSYGICGESQCTLLSMLADLQWGDSNSSRGLNAQDSMKSLLGTVENVKKIITNNVSDLQSKINSLQSELQSKLQETTSKDNVINTMQEQIAILEHGEQRDKVSKELYEHLQHTKKQLETANMELTLILQEEKNHAKSYAEKLKDKIRFYRTKLVDKNLQSEQLLMHIEDLNSSIINFKYTKIIPLTNNLTSTNKKLRSKELKFEKARAIIDQQLIQLEAKNTEIIMLTSSLELLQNEVNQLKNDFKMEENGNEENLTHLKSERMELEMTIDELHIENKVKSEQLFQLQHNLSDLESQLSEVSCELDSFKWKYEQSNGELLKSEATLSNIRNQLISSLHKLKTCRGSSSANSAPFSAVVHDHDAIDKILTGINYEIESLLTENIRDNSGDSVKTEEETIASEQSQQSIIFKQQSASLQQELFDSKAKNQKLSDLVTATKEEMKQRAKKSIQKLKQLEESLTVKTQENSELLSKITVLQDNIESSHTEILELNNRIDNLKLEHDEETAELLLQLDEVKQLSEKRNQEIKRLREIIHNDRTYFERMKKSLERLAELKCAVFDGEDGILSFPSGFGSGTSTGANSNNSSFRLSPSRRNQEKERLVAMENCITQLESLSKNLEEQQALLDTEAFREIMEVNENVQKQLDSIRTESELNLIRSKVHLQSESAKIFNTITDLHKEIDKKTNECLTVTKELKELKKQLKHSNDSNNSAILSLFGTPGMEMERLDCLKTPDPVKVKKDSHWMLLEAKSAECRALKAKVFELEHKKKSDEN